MVCRGIVKEGKVELEPGTSLPEGTRVQVEPLAGNSPADDAVSGREGTTSRDWLAEWRQFAREVGAACEDGPSLVETLRQMRNESDGR